MNYSEDGMHFCRTGMITDTKAEAEKRQNEIFARLSDEQKVRLAMELSDIVRDIAWEGFRRRHPLVSEERLRAMFFREIHGIELRKASEGQGDVCSVVLRSKASNGSWQEEGNTARKDSFDDCL